MCLLCCRKWVTTMPLLKRKPYVLSEPPTDLKPRQHVYQIRFTREIFRDYEYPDFKSQSYCHLLLGVTLLFVFVSEKLKKTKERSSWLYVFNCFAFQVLNKFTQLGHIVVSRVCWLGVLFCFSFQIVKNLRFKILISFVF